jgi:hypothetical protein
MTDEPKVQYTFAVNAFIQDPDPDEDKLQKQAKYLLEDIRENCNEVDRADRAENLNPEAGGKPGIATLIGVLSAQVNIKNIQGFLSFLGDRLKDKPIKIIVKVGDKETTIEVNSRQELLESEKIVKNLLEAMGKEKND